MRMSGQTKSARHAELRNKTCKAGVFAKDSGIKFAEADISAEDKQIKPAEADNQNSYHKDMGSFFVPK